MRWSLKFHDKSAHIRIEGVSLGQFISLHFIPLHFIPLHFTFLISLTSFHPPGKLCCFQILTHSHGNAEFWRHDYGTHPSDFPQPFPQQRSFWPIWYATPLKPSSRAFLRSREVQMNTLPGADQKY